ncbi:MAG: hypothetical protein KGS73_19250 [Chloroflexi bacterium]|jgi:hypothetical protein|nr:hypothetical protein [Chloroflexota bacterium]
MAVELKVTLSESAYDRVVRLARLRRQDIGETVARFLEEELPIEGEEEGVTDWSEADEAVDQEIAAYHRLHSDLWRKYPGQHVAIHNGRLVDHDADGLALSHRIYSRYPDTFVLVRQVEAQPERVIQLRSPRYIQDAGQ